MAMPLSTSSFDQSGQVANPSLRRMFTCVACFLAAYIFVDRAVAYGLGRLVLNSQFRYSRMLNGGVNAEILILGNSRGVNGFYAPDIEAMTGKKVFNLSYNGLSMEGSLLMYKAYLEKNTPPEYLFIEVTSIHLDGAPRELMQLYSFTNDKFKSEWSKLNSQEAWLARNLSNVHYFNNEMFLRAVSYLYKNDQNWINRYTINTDFAKNFKPTAWMQSEWHRVKDKQVDALLEIIFVAERTNCETILVVTPYLPNYIEKIEKFNDWVQNVENRLPGKHHIVDFSRAIKENQYFADPLHMNINGFEVFKEQLKASFPASIFIEGQRK